MHAAYATVTLYEISWWLVGTQLEWELMMHCQKNIKLIHNRLAVSVIRQSSSTTLTSRN